MNKTNIFIVIAILLIWWMGYYFSSKTPDYIDKKITDKISTATGKIIQEIESQSKDENKLIYENEIKEIKPVKDESASGSLSEIKYTLKSGWIEYSSSKKFNQSLVKILEVNKDSIKGSYEIEVNKKKEIKEFSYKLADWLIYSDYIRKKVISYKDIEAGLTYEIEWIDATKEGESALIIINSFINSDLKMKNSELLDAYEKEYEELLEKWWKEFDEGYLKLRKKYFWTN